MLKEKDLLIGDSFEFHDVSTTSGRLQLLFHRIIRWRWLPAISGLALVGLLTIVAASAAINRGNHVSEKLPRSLAVSTDETGKPVLFSAGPPPWVASKIAAKSKPIPPWLPGFLDQFPWVNKTVVDDLFAKADPASTSWIAPSTLPASTGTTKPVPTWLPGFLSNFPWINKSVIDTISSELAAKANTTPSPILEARSIVKIKVRKPVPIWVPELLKSTLINKTIAGKVPTWDTKTQAEAINTLALKLAVQKIAAESVKTTKPLPAWLPTALESIPGVDKASLIIIHSKAAAASKLSAPPKPVVKSKIPAWLPEYLDKFPWMNKTIVAKLQSMVDTEATTTSKPTISAAAPAPTLGVTGALPLSPEVISLLKAAGVSLVPVKPKGTTTESSATEAPTDAPTTAGPVATATDLASLIDALLSAVATEGPGDDTTERPDPATTVASDSETTTAPKPVPEWLPDFLGNLPWINKTIIEQLKAKTQAATTEIPETTTAVSKKTKATKAPKKKFFWPTKPTTTTPAPEAIAQQLLLEVAEGAIKADSSTSKPIPAWLPNFLDLFIPNKAVIAALKAKLAALETTTAADLDDTEAPTEAPETTEEPTSKESETTEAPEDVETTEAPDDAETTQAPEDSETTEAPEDSETTEAPEDSEPTEAPELFQVPPNATLIFWSDGTEVFPSLDTILTNLSDVLTLEIHNFIIDAPTLSDDLAQMPALESLTIEASQLNGDFSPVLLPSLESFQLSLTDTDLSTIDSDLLASLLFPTKNESDQSSLVPDVPEILLQVDGVKILEISDSTSDLLVNVPAASCSEVLDSLDTSAYDNIQLFSCPLTSLPVFSKNLTVLNLHDALPTEQDVLDDLMSSLNSTSLKELHLYSSPTEDEDQEDTYVLDVSSLPSTVTELSLSGIDLTASSSEPTAITELTLEKCNVAPAILANWTLLFPDLDTVNLLSLSETEDQQYPLLWQVIQAAPAVVTVTGMGRQGYTDGASPVQDAVELALVDLFVSPDMTDFILNLRNDTRYGQPLPDKTKMFRRYSLLAFDEVEEYPSYLKYDSAAGAVLGIRSWITVITFTLIAMMLVY